MENDKYFCSNCLKEINAFIICTECRNIRLCFTCFSSGVESGIHKKYHSYRFEAQKQHIFDGDWTCEEELRLLYALEQFGVGNWEDISLKVETKKAHECMQHYCAFYLEGIIGSELNDLGRKYYCKITDHTAGILTPSPSEQNSPRSLCLNIEDQHLLGYMPDRGDFERDYDNDAESILCRLHPSFSHDELEDALKVAQVAIYIQRLRERQRRKDIAREHGLIAHILASILNKRLKRRILSIKKTGRNASKHHSTKSSSLRKALRSRALPNRTTPIRQTKSGKQTTSSSFAPPPGSWLAAPFTLQASGASKGAPLVNGLSVATNAHLNKPMFHLQLRENVSRMDNFNAFCLNEKLKPFLRYFTGIQEEESLKHEIQHLLDLRSRGKVKLNSQRCKFPSFKSSIYQMPQRTDNPLLDLTNTPSRTKKRRRHIGSTPWYAKVQRKSKAVR